MVKTVLITGCSSGIGLAAAKLFHAKGWNVAATMRSPDCSGGKELSHLDARLDVLKLNVQDPGEIKEVVDKVIEKFGRVDLLINNAGYGQLGLLEATSREKIVEQFEVNVFGPIDMIKAVLPHFRSNLNQSSSDGGSKGMIINIGSGASKFTLPNMSLYCASKHALEGLTEAISYELLSQGVTVKMFDPCSGIAETNFRERSLVTSFASDSSLTSYNEYLERVARQNAKIFHYVGMSAGEVAEGIYEAATDGKDQLHYYAYRDPTDLLGNKQRRGEQEWIHYVRDMFEL